MSSPTRGRNTRFPLFTVAHNITVSQREVMHRWLPWKKITEGWTHCMRMCKNKLPNCINRKVRRGNAWIPCVAQAHNITTLEREVMHILPWWKENLRVVDLVLYSDWKPSNVYVSWSKNSSWQKTSTFHSFQHQLITSQQRRYVIGHVKLCTVLKVWEMPNNTFTVVCLLKR